MCVSLDHYLSCSSGTMKTYIIVILCLFIKQSDGHGYMIEPPQRSSMWRVYPGFPANYNDMELFCGGVTKQWGEFGGKCGTCGDAYDADPRENEAGGKYATGVIGRYYTRGQIITVRIRLTASHLGNFQFKICPHNNTHVPVTQECLDQHRLKIIETGDYYFNPVETGYYEIHLDLPEDIVCSQCVLQWHYTAGNTWGCNDNDCCLGCVAKQETFINCADVAIYDYGMEPPITSTALPTVAPSTVVPTSTVIPTSAHPTSAENVGTPMPTNTPIVTSAPGVSTSCEDGYTLMCDGLGDFAGDASRQKYCNSHCRQQTALCTSQDCVCTCRKIICLATGPFEGIESEDAWCQSRCTMDMYGCPDYGDRCSCTED